MAVADCAVNNAAWQQRGGVGQGPTLRRGHTWTRGLNEKTTVRQTCLAEAQGVTGLMQTEAVVRRTTRSAGRTALFDHLESRTSYQHLPIIKQMQLQHPLPRPDFILLLSSLLLVDPKYIETQFLNGLQLLHPGAQELTTRVSLSPPCTCEGCFSQACQGNPAEVQGAETLFQLLAIRKQPRIMIL